MLSFTVNVSVADITPIEEIAAKKLGVKKVDKCVILKKSVDARKKDDIYYVYKLAVEVKNEHMYKRGDVTSYIANICSIEQMTKDKKLDCKPVVVGSGPSGLFAALTLAYLGAKPIVIERGDDVDTRTEKMKAFCNSLILDTESNVQFGEGGAGTFSDGKLNTGTHGEFTSTVINEFVLSGAPEEISYLSKPHVGTDVLVGVVKSLRRRIIELGGEFHFGTKLTDIISDGEKVKAAVTNKGVFHCDKIFLAIGHSARDTFEMLRSKNVFMVSKTYSMGVRIEHLRETINEIQYGKKFAGTLPAADYKAAVDLPSGGKLYTFCMCPGGKVINASSEEKAVCVNGMSYHARNCDNSNSALLYNVTAEDWKSEEPLAGMEYQRETERRAYAFSGSYKPIVQTVGDLLKGKTGTEPSSVKPSVETGYALGEFKGVLPEKVCNALKEGIPIMGKKMKGFDASEAILTGVETRSSSPVRIVRGEDGQASLKGLYPIGEGAGYAGGIVSAAADGVRAVFNCLK